MSTAETHEVAGGLVPAQVPLRRLCRQTIDREPMAYGHLRRGPLYPGAVIFIVAP